MNIRWDAESVEILLNPRIKQSDRELYTKLLKEKDLRGHLWFATSGTTAGLKFAALSKEAILCSALAVNKHFNVTNKDIWINVLPTFHVGGVGIFARGVQSGAKVINLYSENDRWNPRVYVQAVKDACATLSALVPTQVYDLVLLNLQAPSTLRAVVVGGGALDHLLFQDAKSLGWPLVPSYGLTECASQVATCKGKEYGHAKILGHVQLSIDAEGVIHLKSPSLLTCYALYKEGSFVFHDPKKNEWLQTDDIGKREGDYLEVLGRKSDFLKVGGESVSLQKVQNDLDALKRKLGIRPATVLMPEQDARLGQVIVLYVEGNAVVIDLLIKEHNERALPYERIHRVFSVEKIPRNAMGKPSFLTHLIPILERKFIN